MTDIVILDGARTAIGTFGGALAGTPLLILALRRPRPQWNALALRAHRSGMWSLGM